MKITSQALSLLLITSAAAQGKHQVSYQTPLAPRDASLLPKDADGTLAALFGSEDYRDSFFQSHFGSDVIHMERSNAELPSPVMDVNMKELFDSSPISLRNRGSSKMVNKDEMTFEDFQDYIAKGGSAVASIFKDETMLPLKESIEDSLGMPVSMNVYHSGPEGVALVPHTDMYDVIVVQMEGTKEWEICVPIDAKPEDAEDDSMSAADVADIKEALMAQVQGCSTHEEEARSKMQCSNKTMSEGDMLYLPKGIVHSATTSEGVPYSTHVTIGLVREWFRYGDLLMTLLEHKEAAEYLDVEIAKDPKGRGTTRTLLSRVVEDVMQHGTDGAALGFRRMLPPWIWKSYAECTSEDLVARCDTDKFEASKAFLFESLEIMLNQLEEETSLRVFDADAASFAPCDGEEETDDKDDSSLRGIFGKKGWIAQIAMKEAIAMMKDERFFVETAKDHFEQKIMIARRDSNQFVEDKPSRQYLRSRKKPEKPAMTPDDIQREAQESGQRSVGGLIKELQSNPDKYPNFAFVQDVMAAGDENHPDLLAAQRRLGIECTDACNVLQDLCHVGCDVVQGVATACYGTCSAVYSTCVAPCYLVKTCSCDGTCTTGCDGGCISSCDGCGFCLSSCDSGCIWSCDYWGVSSCDSGCTGSCDGTCAYTCGCDGTCTSGCDGGCISSCDSYCSCGLTSGCTSAKNWCEDGCDVVQDEVAVCRETCETDMGWCDIVCGYVDMATEAIANEIVQEFENFKNDVAEFVAEIESAISTAITEAKKYVNYVADLFDEFKVGFTSATASLLNNEKSDIMNAISVAVSGAILVSLAFTPIALYPSIMAWLPEIGFAGIALSASFSFLNRVASVGITLVGETANPLDRKAIVLEVCYGYSTTYVISPTDMFGADVGYGVTFGKTMTFEDATMMNSDGPFGIDLGQKYTISTDILTYFKIPIGIGGSVGWNMVDDSGKFINPFATAPTSISFQAASADIAAPTIISVEYAMCAAFGFVADMLDLFTRRQLTERQEEINERIQNGIRRRMAERRELSSPFEESGLSGGKGNANKNGNSGKVQVTDLGKKAWESMPKDPPGQTKKGNFTAANMGGSMKVEDYVPGHGMFDRFNNESFVPSQEITRESTDRAVLVRLRNVYNEYFKEECGGMNFQDYLKTLEADLTTEDYEALIEYMGANPDDFDDIDYDSIVTPEGRRFLYEHEHEH